MFACTEISIGGRRLLLASNQAVHLVGLDEAGRAAIPDWDDSPQLWHDHYDRDAVTAKIWAHKTLCGRGWPCMAQGEGPVMFPWRVEPELTPTCRACLRIVGSDLTSTMADDRINLLTQMAIECVTRVGEARIFGVPGDQVEHLRKALRAGLRESKLKGRTYAYENSVSVWSMEAYHQIPDEVHERRKRRMSEIIGALLDGEEPPPMPAEDAFQIDWGLWSVV